MSGTAHAATAGVDSLHGLLRLLSSLGCGGRTVMRQELRWRMGRIRPFSRPLANATDGLARCWRLVVQCSKGFANTLPLCTRPGNLATAHRSPMRRPWLSLSLACGTTRRNTPPASRSTRCHLASPSVRAKVGVAASCAAYKLGTPRPDTKGPSKSTSGLATVTSSRAHGGSAHRG